MLTPCQEDVDDANDDNLFENDADDDADNEASPMKKRKISASAAARAKAMKGMKRGSPMKR